MLIPLPSTTSIEEQLLASIKKVVNTHSLCIKYKSNILWYTLDLYKKTFYIKNFFMNANLALNCNMADKMLKTSNEFTSVIYSIYLNSHLL